MFALVMYEEYLNDILQGKRKYDIRLYSTKIRGRIALVKSGTNLIYGFVDLVSIKLVSYEKYICWHISDRYSSETAMEEIIRNNSLGITKISYAYEYQFDNLRVLNYPHMILSSIKKGPWITFDIENIQKPYIQIKLF